MDAYRIVRDFEQALCDYTGAPYCVTTDSCSNAIMISLQWWKDHAMHLYDESPPIMIPKRTYPSVANTIKRLGFNIEFLDGKWFGAYRLEPTNVVDCAKRFKRNMYEGGYSECLSFHGKKHLNIGRGGAILTENKEFAKWARWMRFDGRPEGVPLSKCELQGVGFNCYMTPEQAARGLELMQFVKDEYPEEYEPYQDLSKYEFYK